MINTKVSFLNVSSVCTSVDSACVVEATTAHVGMGLHLRMRRAMRHHGDIRETNWRLPTSLPGKEDGGVDGIKTYYVD